MVFHYTNFIVETNTWWLRRIRPLWMGAAALLLVWTGYRYYFFGKNGARWNRKYTDEEWKERAELNKRDWGYNAHYKPELGRSMKKVLYKDPNYQFPIGWSERYMSEERTLEQIMEEENKQWHYYK